MQQTRQTKIAHAAKGIKDVWKPPRDTQTPVNARALVEDLVRLHQIELNRNGIDASIDMPVDSMLFVDSSALAAAVSQLISNAIESMPQGGELFITAYEDHNGFELEIGDSGPGLAQSDMARIFEPGFTTKPERPGLGLSNVKQFIDRVGGRASAMNCPEGGAAFTLHFPPTAAKRSAA